jgi:hypothetical protein
MNEVRPGNAAQQRKHAEANTLMDVVIEPFGRVGHA